MPFLTQGGIFRPEFLDENNDHHYFENDDHHYSQVLDMQLC